jgi:integrase
MANKLTKRTVDALASREREYTEWDTELRGFGCRVFPQGRKTFVYYYRVGGGRRSSQRKMKLGVYCEAFTVDQARTMARQVHADTVRGDDPAGDRAARRKADTLEEFAKQYMSDHSRAVKKASSAKSDQWLLDRHILPKLGNRKVVDLTTAEIARFIRASATQVDRRGRERSTPTLANRIRALLSHMMTLAIKWDVRPDRTNPVIGVEKFPERSLERFLLGVELKRLGEVLREAETNVAEPWQAIAAIRLLVLTGCRKGEILSLKWNYIDRENGVLLLPDSKTGKKTIYLTPPVAELLDTLPRVQGCPYVLPAQRAAHRRKGYSGPAREANEGHFIGVAHVWERLRKKAGLHSVRLNDLRHTFASKGVGLGVSLPLIGGLLGHADMKTTAKYAHLSADPTRQAGMLIAQRLHADLGLGTNVVLFPGPRSDDQAPPPDALPAQANEPEAVLVQAKE